MAEGVRGIFDIKKIILSQFNFESLPFSIPKIQSHRGAWNQSDCPENTIAAFQRAKTLGFKMVEMDLHLTGDKIPVVFHDKDLKRMMGSDQLVTEISFQDLRQKFPVPSLEEVLMDLNVPPFLNLEIKSDSVLDEQIERRVAEVFGKQKTTKSILFSSFNPATLWKLRNYLPDVPRAFLVNDEKLDNNPVWLRELLVLPILSVHMLNLNGSLVETIGPEFLERKKIPYSVWTVNDRDKIDQYLEDGAMSVITDNSVYFSESR